ncbi:MAG: ABC transporter permease, partial [Myxococcota bacterium]
MSFSRLVQLALGSLRRNLARAFLTILGVVIGVGSVVVMVAIGQGAKAQIEARVKSLGTNLVVVTPGASTTGGVSGGAGSMDSLKLEDAEAIGREGQSVGAVTPVVQTFSFAVVGSQNWRTSIHGVDTSWFDIRDWDVASGRPFEEADVRASRKVVVLGATVAKALFGEEDPVGRELRLRRVPLTIIGVLAKKGPTAEGTDQDDVAILPYTTVRQRMSGRQFLGQILVQARSETEIPDAMTEVRGILRETHRLGARAPDDFTIRDQSEIAAAASGTTRVMTTLLSAVASVSLVVGGIGIMNIMLVSVTERTREIGIRRALGARRADVLAQFLVEAIVLSVSGGVLGAVLGVTVAWILGRVTGWATPVTPASIGLAMAFSGAVGVFFGWYPARRAAALDPI